VLITGGASGIGLATAELLAAQGWNLAVVDQNEAALAAAAKCLPASRAIRFSTVDVTNESAVERVVGETAEAFRTITGVVNSAGIAMNKHTFDTPIDMFRRILDVNVVGTFLVGRAAARIMRDRGGSIVNIASISGLRGSKDRAAYGASKGAVVTLTQVMATDLARYNIRVNAVAPGPVETPMVKAAHSDEERALYRRFIPMRRYATPAEIAHMIHFLLDGTRSSYVTGEIIAVDGGYRGAGLVPNE
jgi:NAD(P)-dependent dehydrogenase (short-subunit alcohol dehydrogenase family)